MGTSMSENIVEYFKLKEQAEALGYHLVKKQETIRFSPCVCGAKKSRSLWQSTETGNWFYRCRKCGLTSNAASTKIQAKIEWNKTVESKLKEG